MLTTDTRSQIKDVTDISPKSLERLPFGVYIIDGDVVHKTTRHPDKMVAYNEETNDSEFYYKPNKVLEKTGFRKKVLKINWTKHYSRP